MHLHRSVAKPLEHERPIDPRSTDRTLVYVLGVTWLLSVARVAIALRAHEMFGTEGTLAIILVAFLPSFFQRSIL